MPPSVAVGTLTDEPQGATTNSPSHRPFWRFSARCCPKNTQIMPGLNRRKKGRNPRSEKLVLFIYISILVNFSAAERRTGHTSPHRYYGTVSVIFRGKP